VVLPLLFNFKSSFESFFNLSHPTTKQFETLIIKGNKMTEMLTKADFLTKVFDYENNKEWNYQGDVPALIDFYADWCQPCKMVAPILEELGEEFAGKIKIYKVDTEAEQELSSIFGIKSIPSLLFIPKDGKPQMAQGALQKPQLKEAIENVLFAVDTNA
jgi:thioredoxin